jgi:hypothetical protein
MIKIQNHYMSRLCPKRLKNESFMESFISIFLLVKDTIQLLIKKLRSKASNCSRKLPPLSCASNYNTSQSTIAFPRIAS